MKFIKMLGLFFLFIILYFIPSFLFKIDGDFYKAIPKPFYAPSTLIFKLAWPILYTLLSFFLAYKIMNQTLTRELILYFILNYIISFFFIKVFFIDKDFFLSFAITFCSFISGFFILLTTFKESRTDFLFILPYTLWTLYASILMAHIYLIQ